MPAKPRQVEDRPLIGGAARWASAGPLLLFALLCGFAGLRAGPGGAPAWLSVALERAAAIQAGSGLLVPGQTPLDPRATTGALALAAGVSPATLTLLVSLAGLVLGALGVLSLIPRPIGYGAPTSGRGRAAAIEYLPAYLLVSSPYWIHASLEASPYLAVGLLFWLIGGGRGPAGALGVAMAWALSWSPWAWVALWPLAWGWALRGPEGRRRGVVLLLLGTLLVGAFAPEVLGDPSAWLRGMLWRARVEGLASGLRPFGVATGWAPLCGTLHGPALALLVWSGRGWAERVRRGELAPLIVLLILAASLPAGFSPRAPLVLLLIWGAAEAGRGARALWGLWPRAGWGTLLALAAVLPLLGTQISQASKQSSSVAAGTEAVAYLERHLAPGSLVAYDLGVAPPSESELHWVPIPFHSVAPQIHQGAYWTGWYRGCAALLVSEAMVRRFLARADDVPGIIGFYLELQRSGERQRTFGEHPGRRVQLIEQRPAADGTPAPGWRARVAQGAAGGLQGSFLARIGGALTRAGRDAAGVALLEEARLAGYEEVGIFINLAAGYLAQDRLLEAGRTLEAGLEHHPQEPDLLSNLALVLTRLGYWERAVETLSLLRTLRPQSAQIAYRLGVSLANVGHPVAARQVLLEAQGLAAEAGERARIGAALEALDRDR